MTTSVPVIVLLKSQPAVVRPATAAAKARAAEIAKHVRSFGLVNAVAGTVSKGEEAATSSATTGPATGSQVCPDPGKVMLEPEALGVTHTDSDTANA